MAMSKLPAVKAITQLSGSTIYRLAAAGKFPKPIMLGATATAWLDREVYAWVQDRINARNQNPEQRTRGRKRRDETLKDERAHSEE
jgi:prophage regulatory protein